MSVTSLRSRETLRWTCLPYRMNRFISGRALTLTLPARASCIAPVWVESVIVNMMVVSLYSGLRAQRLQWLAAAPRPRPPVLQAVKVQVHNRRRVQGKRLAHNQAADDGDSERTA